MNKTEHYSLNQWEASDRVLMADFNADNAALDQALHSLAQRPSLQLLKTFTTTEEVAGTDSFTMDVSDIDWGSWQSVYVDLNLRGSGYMLLYPNGDKNDASSSGYTVSTGYDSLAGLITCDSSDGTLVRVEFQICRNPGMRLRTVCPYERVTGWAGTCTYGELEKLHLTPYKDTFYMYPGSVITFWGLG